MTLIAPAASVGLALRVEGDAKQMTDDRTTVFRFSAARGKARFRFLAEVSAIAYAIILGVSWFYGALSDQRQMLFTAGGGTIACLAIAGYGLWQWRQALAAGSAIVLAVGPDGLKAPSATGVTIAWSEIEKITVFRGRGAKQHPSLAIDVKDPARLGLGAAGRIVGRANALLRGGELVFNTELWDGSSDEIAAAIRKARPAARLVVS